MGKTIEKILARIRTVERTKPLGMEIAEITLAPKVYMRVLAEATELAPKQNPFNVMRTLNGYPCNPSMADDPAPLSITLVLRDDLCGTLEG